MKTFYVYILSCADSSYYVGVTSDLNDRIIKHKSRFYKDSYTSSRLPVELVYFAEFSDPNGAISKEKQIKKWSKKKKQALINGEFGLLRELSKKSFK